MSDVVRLRPILAGVGGALCIGAVGLGIALAPPPTLELKLVIDGQEEIVVRIWPNADGFIRLETFDHYAPANKRRRQRALLSTEVARIRILAREAHLFSAQSLWNPHQSPELPLVTLSVSEGEHIASLVCSQDASFQSGPRRDLLSYLPTLLTNLEDW